MTHVHNRAIGVPDPAQGKPRQADPARTSNRSAPPPPLPCPQHPFAARVQNLIAAGKTKGQALRAAIAADPDGHQSWLKQVQPHG